MARAAGTRAPGGPRCARRHRARHRRPHQHPVHLGYHRIPEGRDAVAPQHPQQRVLRRRAVQLHRGGPDLHSGAVLPLLRHGHGQPLRDQPRRVHGHPGSGLRPGRDPAGRAGRTLHLAVRRAHHVHRRAVRPRLRRLRPVQPAHRHHGRLAVPGRGDEAGHRADGHGRGRDLLRHDGNLAGVHPDPCRRLARPPGVHRGPGRAAPRGQGHRPGDRPDRCRAAPPASCAPAGTR